MSTQNEIPSAVAALFEQDPRIVAVREYTDGWVPNAYRWRAPGTARHYTRRADGAVAVSTFTYDRKRSHARGPWLVGLSARGGRLASR